MSETEKPKTEAKPESPTTARELDFENEQEEIPVSPISNAPKPETPAASTPAPITSGEDAPPPKPPRPLHPHQQAENTLKEAFPSIDPSVVKAVLVASNWQVESAFNALLGMSDPDAHEEAQPPPQPPRPARTPTGPTSTAQSQLEADELYARQLAEHYSGAAAYDGQPRSRSRGQQQRRAPSSEVHGEDRSFIDDDLPVIRENIKKGFLETQSKVNNWVTNMKKRLDGEDDDFQARPARTATGLANQTPSYGRRSGEYNRRSAERDRYDADPQVLGDDFGNLQLRDDEAPPKRSNRPLANPDLFKPTPTSPPPHGAAGRRVSFQDTPAEEIDDDLYGAPPEHTKRPPSGGINTSKPSKWQPLSAVDPAPVGEHDPFSLGDSDEEDAKKKEDIKADDSERLKKAAAEAMEENIGGGTAKGELRPAERNGSLGMRDKVAEEKVTGSS